MISEGSCDTEDWSNDAENSGLVTGINYNLQYIQIDFFFLNCNNISQYYCFYSVSGQINGEHTVRDFFQKILLTSIFS